MAEEVYVSLLDEDTEVWRPVPAWRIDDSTYIILRPDWYDPDDERWEFPPGSTVICEQRQVSDGTILAAVRRKQMDRQSA